MSTINLFPTLTNNLISKIDPNLDQYKFFHDDSAVNTRGIQKKTEIILEDYSTDLELLVQDVNGSWDVNYDNLYIETELIINEPSKLFGPKGVAPKGAILGVATRWFSRESKQRGVEKNFEINSNDTKIRKKIRMKFEENQLRETLNIEIILYISKVSETVNSGEEHLANQSGIILGILDTVRMILEGDSSAFPIQTVKAGKGPLWDLHVGWEDLEDKFNDSVWLRINEEHKDYKYLEVKNKAFSRQLLDEIMVITISLLVQTVMESGEIDRIRGDNSFQSGSVGFLIRYFLEIYEVDTQSPISLYSTISKGVRK